MQRALFILVAFSLAPLLVGLAPAGPARAVTVSGYISCSNLPKGTSPSDSDSVRKCLEKGGLTVIVLDDSHDVLAIENPEAVKGHEGHRVLLTGEAGANGFHVYSLRII